MSAAAAAQLQPLTAGSSPLASFINHESSSTDKPLSRSQRRKEAARRRWADVRYPLLQAALRDGDDDAAALLMAELLDIIDPQLSLWTYLTAVIAYCLTIFVLAPLLIFHHHGLVPALSAVSALYALTSFAVRVYFTFRSRILTNIGYDSARHRNREYYLDMIVTCLIEMLAVGDPAFRLAPLEGAWAGMTGRERIQPGWQRDLILLSVILTEPILVLVVFGTLSFLPALLIWSITMSDSLILRPIAIILVVPSFLLPILYVPAVPFCLTQLDRFATRQGYPRNHRSPFARGYADQVLASWRVPNPARDRELARDARLAAAVKGE